MQAIVQAYIRQYLQEMKAIAQELLDGHTGVIGQMIASLAHVRQQRGRVFIAGVGGGAGTGSHAANDFMKIAGIATINLSDNVSLLTALANDEGWSSIFIRQLQMHRFSPADCLCIFSVGGGTDTASPNLTEAIKYAGAVGAPVIGVVGKATGYAAQHGTAVLVIPTVHPDRITPHTESWQLVLDHLLVNALAQMSITKQARQNIRGAQKNRHESRRNAGHLS